MMCLCRIPEGANVYGTVVLHHRIWGHWKRRSTTRLTVGTARSTVDSLESHAATLSKTLFPHLSPREILENHSIFGFYSRALDPAAADEWSRELIAENGLGWRRYLESTKTTRTTKRELSLCPACVTADVGQYGYAIWRAIHQIEGLRFCPEHGSPLLSRCEYCGVQLDSGDKWRLPADPCWSCGKPPTIRPDASGGSIGEIEFARDCGRLARGELGILRPREWACFMRRCVDHLGGNRKALGCITTDLTTAWSHSRADLIKVAQTNRARVNRELSLLARPGEIRGRLVIFGALCRIGLEADAFDVVSRKAESVADQVEHVLARFSLPLGLSEGIRRRESLNSLAGRARVPATRIAEAIRALDAASRAEVTCTDQNWLVEPRLPPRSKVTPAERRRVYRSKLLWARQHWESARRVDLQRGMPKVMAWLRHHDRKWLYKHLPPRVLRGHPAWGTGKCSWRTKT